MLDTLITSKWVDINVTANMLVILITAKWVDINDYHKTCWLPMITANVSISMITLNVLVTILIVNRAGIIDY